MHGTRLSPAGPLVFCSKCIASLRTVNVSVEESQCSYVFVLHFFVGSASTIILHDALRGACIAFTQADLYHFSQRVPKQNAYAPLLSTVLSLSPCSCLLAPFVVVQSKRSDDAHPHCFHLRGMASTSRSDEIRAELLSDHGV